MPFPKGKYKVLTLDLPKDILDEIKKEAMEKRTTVSRIVVEKLMAYVKREKEKK